MALIFFLPSYPEHDTVNQDDLISQLHRTYLVVEVLGPPLRNQFLVKLPAMRDGC